MDDEPESDTEKLDTLLAVKSLLEFAKLSADDVSARALVDAIDDATSAATKSIRDLES